MEKVKLGDVCKVQGGYAFKSKEFQKDSIPIIRIGNIQDNEVEIDYNVCFTKKFLNKHPEFEIKYGDILIAMSGATVGKIGKYQNDTKALLNQRVGNFIVTEKLEKRYLYFLLQSPLFEKFILNNAFGCAQPNISSKQIEEFEFYNYDNIEQIEIANQLDKVQEIIDFRKKQIQELDELIKSQFVELFGSPFCNEKWEIKKIGNMAEIISDGNNIETKYYQETGDVLFLRIQNVWRNEFRLDDSVYVSKEVNDMYLDTSLHTGDILISKIGRYYTKDSSLGRVSLYRGENDKANYSNNIMRIRLKPEYNSEFVNIVLNLEDYQQHIRRESKGGTDKRALSKKIIENFEIINPPIKLQNEYVEKVKLIDKQKSEIQKSLEETQKLQESLMNKYFG